MSLTAEYRKSAYLWSTRIGKAEHSCCLVESFTDCIVFGAADYSVRILCIYEDKLSVSATYEESESW